MAQRMRRRVVVGAGRAAVHSRPLCRAVFRGNAFAAGAGTGAGLGAAGGGDDVLKAVEKLTEIMYFEVLQLLGQGCNGAVFKVGRVRACV